MIQHKMQQTAPSQSHLRSSIWLGPLVYMVAVGLYFIVRYGGQWAEADSTTFTNVIRAFTHDGRLQPASGYLYPNGYAFQSISAVILALTGMDIVTLQQLVYPLLASLVVLPAWIAYREFTGSARGAILATLLIFTQPEFLFVILRSSHEKFTRTFILLCLFLLFRSFKLRSRPGLFATHVGLFYLAAFALVSSNNLLAHSFIVAIALALLFGWALERRSVLGLRENGPIIKRLLYVTLTCLALVYIVTFYVYTPAQHNILVLQDTGERIYELFFPEDEEEEESRYTNAYAYVSFGWISPHVYVLVSIANWIILVASLVIWSRQGLRWLWRGEPPETRAAWLLWLLYAAFVTQGAMSIISDASGALSSNLQHRLFPSFSIIAVGIVGAALAGWRPRRFARPIELALTLGIVCIAVLSVMKATNEPLVSNKWTFYRASELLVLDWSDAHHRDAHIWTEFDERLAVAYANARGDSKHGNRLRGWFSPEVTRSLVVTDLARLRSSRVRVPLPVPPDALQVYDNGEAEVYRLRPETPFQR